MWSRLQKGCRDAESAAQRVVWVLESLQVLPRNGSEDAACGSFAGWIVDEGLERWRRSREGWWKHLGLEGTRRGLRKA